MVVVKEEGRRDKGGSGRGCSLKSPSHEAVDSTLRFQGSKLIANEHLIQLGLASHGVEVGERVGRKWKPYWLGDRISSFTML